MSPSAPLKAITVGDLAEKAFRDFAKVENGGPPQLSKASFLEWWRALDEETIDALTQSIATSGDVSITMDTV